MPVFLTKNLLFSSSVVHRRCMGPSVRKGCAFPATTPSILISGEAAPPSVRRRLSVKINIRVAYRNGSEAVNFLRFLRDSS